MRICVIGLGYIGFPTACLMAGAGHEVIGVDANDALLTKVQNGSLHIAGEDGLAELAQQVLSAGVLTVSSVPAAADAFIICVPTPLTAGPDSVHGKVGGVGAGVAVDQGTSLSEGPAAFISQVAAGGESPTSQPGSHVAPGPGYGSFAASWNGPSVDLSSVESAVHAAARHLQPGNLVIIESTVPPGTTEHVVLPILASHGWNRKDILLAHAPERVLPGSIMREMIGNDRVIGGFTPAATAAAVDLYASLVKGQIHATDATTAEFIKLIENTYRDVNIALANELALAAEALGVDAHEAIPLANRHPRVNILNPGPGVGGHCIPVDPYFIIQRAPQLTPLLQTARAVNDRMIQHVVTVAEQLSQQEGLTRWIILGAAYKANVGDERNSPSLAVAAVLKATGCDVVIHDPFVGRFNQPLESVLAGADALLLMTDHTLYRDLDPALAGAPMTRRFVLDTRNCIDPERWEECGFEVWRLGDGRRSGH